MAKILHVEDHAGWAKAIGDCLRKLGHEVIHFSVLDEAQTAFNQNPSLFDIVICDRSLKDSDKNSVSGLAWAKELYAKGFKVMVISGEDYVGLLNIPYIDKAKFTNIVLETEINKLLLSFNSSD